MLRIDQPVMVKNDIEEYGRVVGFKRNPAGFEIVVVEHYDSKTGERYRAEYAARDVFPN